MADITPRTNCGSSLTRRMFVAGSLTTAVRAQSTPTGEVERYRTPFKYGKLVLEASSEPDAFDSRSVDCPFVFHHHDRFYMTYVGWDGTGYQTGLASSSDLTSWRKEGCILRRDPSSPVTRYNIALNWIVRENELQSPGELKKVRGRFLGVYHAYPNAGYEQGAAVIGLCWSNDLMRWEIDAPFLHPEDGADWERGGLYKPCLVEHRGTYYLFYNAKTQGKSWNEQTGVATSTDLKIWKRYEQSDDPQRPGGKLGRAFRQRPVRADRRPALGFLLLQPR